jgi:hypothetical protein
MSDDLIDRAARTGRVSTGKSRVSREEPGEAVNAVSNDARAVGEHLAEND